MFGLKASALALVGATALAVLPATPAFAAGPLLFAPWAVGHVLGAMARLATLPLAVAAQIQPSPGYAPQGYYPPQQGYYPAPQPYYAGPPAYYPRAPVYGYAPAMPRPYAPPRGDYAPYARYAGSYAPHFSYRSGGYGYRRR